MNEYAKTLGRIVRWVDGGCRMDNPVAHSIRAQSDPALAELVGQLLSCVDREAPDAILDATREQLLRAGCLALRKTGIDASGQRPREAGRASAGHTIGGDSENACRLSVVLERDDRALCELMVGDGDRRLVPKIVPGVYTLRLNTGRVLWRETLTRQRLVSRPDVGNQYRAAASAPDRDSGPGERLFPSVTRLRQPNTDASRALRDEIGVQLTLFRGLESGSLEIGLSPHRRAD